MGTDLQHENTFLELSAVFCHFLYRAPDCFVTDFSAGAITFCERSHWRNHHIAPSHVAYEKHQTASEIKASETVYQLGSAQSKPTSPSSGSSVDFVLLHSAPRSSEKHLNSLQNEQGYREL